MPLPFHKAQNLIASLLICIKEILSFKTKSERLNQMSSLFQKINLHSNYIDSKSISTTTLKISFINTLFRGYTLCKAIHVQRNDTCPTVIPRNCACVKQVLIG